MPASPMPPASGRVGLIPRRRGKGPSTAGATYGSGGRSFEGRSRSTHDNACLRWHESLLTNRASPQSYSAATMRMPPAGAREANERRPVEAWDAAQSEALRQSYAKQAATGKIAWNKVRAFPLLLGG